MQPHFAGPNSTLSATAGAAITPSDSVVIEPLTRGVLVTVAGALAVEYADGTQHVIGEVAQGIAHPLQIRKVLATGTTATGISVFW